MIADLRACAETGAYPSYKVAADGEGMASPRTYKRRFGSWNEALDAAGFDPRSQPRSEQATTEPNGRDPTR